MEVLRQARRIGLETGRDNKVNQCILRRLMNN
jgi:hypothetical protein